MTLLMSAGMAQPSVADQQKKLSALADGARLARATRVAPTPAPVE